MPFVCILSSHASFFFAPMRQTKRETWRREEESNELRSFSLFYDVQENPTECGENRQIDE